MCLCIELCTLKKYLDLVKFSHTIFAMPFAMLGFFIGLHHSNVFTWRIFILIVLCMVFARNAAMAFNRYLDRDIDSLNERTRTREIPAGVITARQALIFVIVNVVLFISASFFINQTCFFLSPIALLIILGYSYTKRFTALCHLVLGLGLALAPLGAYIAVTESFHIIPILYGIAILFWVSGFDIIYALQDSDFDQRNQLRSIPSALGNRKALYLSSFFHVITAVCIIGASYLLGTYFIEMKYLHWIASFIFIGLLVYQHILVKPDNLEHVNMAFFTLNGYASFIFCSLTILDFYL